MGLRFANSPVTRLAVCNYCALFLLLTRIGGWETSARTKMFIGFCKRKINLSLDRADDDQRRLVF